MKTTLALLCLAMTPPPGEDRIVWYYDADTALRAAERSGRPIVLLKIRADVGKDVKT